MAATLDSNDLIPVRRGLATVGRAADSSISRDLIKAMAMDAGKNLCAYLEVMYPEVWHGQNSGFKISMRNHVYNDIMALAELHDEASIRKRLAEHEAHRKKWVGAYRKMRSKKCEHGIRERECGLCEDARRAEKDSPGWPPATPPEGGWPDVAPPKT